MTQRQWHPRSPLHRSLTAEAGVWLVPALGLVDAGIAVATGRLSPMRGATDLVLVLLALSTWLVARDRLRAGRLLALLTVVPALLAARLSTAGWADPLVAPLCAALLLVPAICCRGLPASSLPCVLARGIAATAMFVALACLLHGLGGYAAVGEIHPGALVACALGWLSLSCILLGQGLVWSIPSAASVALSGLGWMGVLGWLIQSATLVQGGANLVPIAFNSALAFVLMGHALWLLASGRAFGAWCLGLLCVPLAVSPLLAECLGWPDFLGELFRRQQGITAEGALPGRLAPNTSLALLAAELGLSMALLARRNAGLWSVAWASGLLVLMAGALSLAGYLFALPAMRTLGVHAHTPMSLPVAVGMAVLGIGLVASSPRSPWERRYRTVIFPAVTCLLTVSLSLLLWLSLERQQVQLQQAAGQVWRENAVTLLHSGMDTLVRATDRLAARLSATTDAPGTIRDRLFDADASGYLRDMDGLRTLVYADAGRVLRRLRAPSSSEIRVGAVLDRSVKRKQLFDRADASAQPVLSAPLTLIGGKRGQLIVAPVRDNAGIQGYVIGALEFDQLFPRLLAALPGQHGVRISQAGEVLYARVGGSGVAPVSTDISLYGQHWRMDVYPDREGIEARVPQLVLLLGFALGGLLAVALRLSALARERARLAEATSAQLRGQGRALERALEASRLMMDSAPDVICVIDRDGRFLQVSAAALRMWGYTPESLVGEPLSRVVHPEDRAGTVAALALVMRGEPNPNFRNRNVTRDGRVLYVQWSATWSAQSQCMYVVGRDYTELRRAENLENRRRLVLAAVAGGRPLPEVLESLVTAYEEHYPGALCSILLLREGRLLHGAAVHLPADYCRSIDGAAIGPEAGSCGTAAWRGERVVVTDIATDPLWQNYASLALPHGLQACWSTPIRARDGSVLGTFAVYYTAPRAPSPEEVSGIDTLAAVAAVAIEHEQSFQRVSESEQRFRSLFDHHPDGVFALGPDGQVMQGNPAGAALLGLEMVELRGRPFTYSFVAAEGARVRQLLTAATHGESARLDVTAQDARGNRFPAHLVGIPIIVEGEARGVFAVLQDHRELRHAQQAMVSQLALIVAIAESVGEGLIAVDLEGQPTFLNHMASRALGLRVDKLPTGSELPVDMVAPLRQILGGTALVSDSDSQFALPDERTLEVAYLAKPLMIHGKLAGAMMAFRDIAAAKGAQRILQQRNHFFEMSQEVFCIADPVTGRFLQVNPAYAKLLGFAEAEMLAIPFIDLLHPLDKAPTQEAIERQMSGAETINGLLTRMRCADDSYRWLEWVSITASDGLLYGAARDVTARREADIALAKAMDDLRIRNRELQDFAYVASHDLQEPLRKIQSFSDRLQSRLGSSLDDSSHDYLRRMGQAALRMQTLIDDLLAYSRVATRTAGVAPVDLAAVLAAVLDDLEARIAEAKAVVTFDPLPTIQADATQMRQLLQNLLANALKFRDAERPCVVAISVRRTGAVFELRVSDNGIGFEPAYAERIFAPFQRLHPRNVYEGTGIGLAIVRRIVERHGGTIRAESDAGQGASFIVTLPVMSGERLSAGRDASSIDGEILGADS